MAALIPLLVSFDSQRANSFDTHFYRCAEGGFMKFAPRSERTEFLETNNLGHLLTADRLPGAATVRYVFEQEDHTQSVFTLAKFLTGLSEAHDATLVTLDLMYVWSSGRDEHLIATALQSMTNANTGRLQDGAMFLWNEQEKHKAATLYHLAMLFGWDAYIIPNGGTVSAFISHDGFLELNTDGDPELLASRAEDETQRHFYAV
ncbi:MAG: hypothetical protein AAF590_13490 [Pseudomonadota bacterium]